MTLPNFDPAFPVSVIATVAGIAAVFTIYRAFHGKKLTPGWFQFPAVLLRFGVIALLSLVLLNPVKRVTVEKPKSSSLILLDRSASMKLSTVENRTRWSEAADWVTQTREAVLAKGDPVPPIAVFNSDLEAIGNPSDLLSMSPLGDETHLASAIFKVLERGGQQTPRQIIVVSDGRAHDLGELPKALTAARDMGAKISTKLIGTHTPPRNAWISAVQAPRTVRARGKISLHIELASTGISPDETLSLVLTEDGGKEVFRTDFRPAVDGAIVEKVLSFEIGMRTTKYLLELIPAGEEVALDDNRYGFTVEVSSNKLRVLFVEGTHVKRTVGETGHWYNDIELMTKAWDASGEIEYECLTPVSEYVDSPNLVGVTFKNGEMRQDRSRSFPSTREDLYRFDVMLISDVPVGNFSKDQMQWVVDWVTERGGGFLMGGGYTTFDVGNYDQTPWERIIPVDMLSYGAGFMEKPFPIRIPEAVRNHPLWQVSDDPQENIRALDAHPNFLGMNRVKRAKPGAIVLAVRADEEGDEPVMAAQTYGRGRSIAWLPDPNGGWARNYVKWGPPGGPRQGAHTELGHGTSFRFKEESANSATGPPPPHPAPWYGQYWVNLVKWLGEPSVRWHRDKLAGRSKQAAAKPGEMLSVAAEVLAVSKLDELFALDVGARLDIPGTPRIRLEYDRDAREFVGDVPIPASADGEQVTVYFDASVNGSGFTDIVPVSLRHSNLEFTETSPNSSLMTELANAAAGRVLNSPQDAANWLSDAAEANEKEAAVTWNEPLWTRWPLLAAIVALLSFEWMLRRRSMIPAVVAAMIFMSCPVISFAQETKSIEQLIAQLGDPKVRLRDEAEDLLKENPKAAEALKQAITEHPSMEGRLRAANTLQALRQSMWTLEKELPTHRSVPMGFAIVTAPDQKHFYTRGEDSLIIWDAATFEPKPVRVEILGSVRDARRLWPTNTLAISPDNKLVVTGSDFGIFRVNDALTGQQQFELIAISGDSSNTISGLTPTTDAAFSPDGEHLATTNYSGNVFHWNRDTGTLLKTVKLASPAQRIIFSNDSRYLIHGMERPSIPDELWIQRLSDGEWTTKIKLSSPPNGLAVSPDGSMIAVAMRNGHYSVWNYHEGTLGPERVIFRGRGNGRGVMFSKDGKSLFTCGTDGNDALQEFDLESGEMIWKAPRQQTTCLRFALLGDDRLLAAYGGGTLKVWKKRR